MSRKIVFSVLLALGVVIAAALVLGALTAPVQAQGPWGGGMMGRGHMGRGMMGDRDGWGPWGNWAPGRGYGQGYTDTVPYGSGPCGFGPMGMMGGGMMGGWGGWAPGRGYGQDYTDTVPYGYGPMGMMGMMGMMGGFGGCPMAGGWGGVDPDAKPQTIDQARENVEKFLEWTGNADLQLVEVMEFTGNFYAEVHEKSTGSGAMELLVDRYTGEVYPEPGPNMMWNTKYGHMGGWGMGGQHGTSDAKMTVTPEQAVSLAQKYLDQFDAGLKVGEAEPFYGYYTLHTEKDGKVTGMLSVNGYTGAVWYHNWHGDFVGMSEEME